MRRLYVDREDDTAPGKRTTTASTFKKDLHFTARLDDGPYARKARYLKVRDRSSYEFALVSAAAALHVEDGVIKEARIAAGGVGTRPWRMNAVEQALVGKPAARSSYETAAAVSTEGTRPLSQNGFKVKLLPATIVRALEMAGEVA
jgi:xanthine dehydrogenase YagS FAD-binding subunit